jgi:hypothetical protein
MFHGSAPLQFDALALTKAVDQDHHVLSTVRRRNGRPLRLGIAAQVAFD